MSSNKEEETSQKKEEESAGQMKEEESADQTKEEESAGQTKEEESAGQTKEEETTGQRKEEEESAGQTKEEEATDQKKEEESGQKKEDDFTETFETFSKFGDNQSDGTSISLRNIDKWLQQAKILDDSIEPTKEQITKADTAISFAKVSNMNVRINQKEFEQFMTDLAKDKNIDKEEMMGKLKAIDEPELSNITKPIKQGVLGELMDRMTDTSKYTGSHKERFDEEGKGKGIEGREETADTSGYKKDEKKKEEKEKS